MSTSYTFTFKVTQCPNGHHNKTPENAINNTRQLALMALIRAMASNPSMYLGLKDGDSRKYLDTKCYPSTGGVEYKIEIHEIKI